MNGQILDRATLFLEICGCGNRCKHCYIPNHKERYKDFKAATEIIDKYAELLEHPAVTNKAQLYFHDDPTLYPNIAGLLDHVKSKGLSVCPTLSTNGFGLVKRPDGQEILQAFINSGIKGLNIALYGDREYHDWFAGLNGSFDMRLRAAAMAKEAGLWVHWNLYLTRNNTRQLITLTKELNTKNIDIAPPGFTSNWSRYPALHPTMAEYDIIRREMPEFTYEKRFAGNPRMGTILPESRWVEICRNADELKPYLEDDNAEPEPVVKTMWLMEIESNLYDSEECFPAYLVGNILRDSLRGIYESGKHSAGYGLLKDENTICLAEQHGDPRGEFIGLIDVMRTIWASRKLKRHHEGG